MPAKLAKKNNKSCEAGHRAANTSSMVSTELTTSAELPTASETTTLGPALRQVIEEITGNITSFITQKVDSLAEVLKSQAAEVKELAQRTTDRGQNCSPGGWPRLSYWPHTGSRETGPFDDTTDQ